MNAFHRFLTFYQTCVYRAPYLTNCTLGFFIAGIGDVICQKYFENGAPSSSTQKKLKVEDTLPHHSLKASHSNEPSLIIQEEEEVIPTFIWNKERSMKMGLIRAFVITPFVMFWYPFVTALSPGQTLLRILRRVFIDQCTGAPICIILVFLANALLNNELQNVGLQLQQQLYITWVTGLKYWPFVHIITFGVIPPPMQPLFAHFASVYWNAVLSFYSNKKVILPSPSIPTGGGASIGSSSSSPSIRSDYSDDSQKSRKSV